MAVTENAFLMGDNNSVRTLSYWLTTILSQRFPIGCQQFCPNALLADNTSVPTLSYSIGWQQFCHNTLLIADTNSVPKLSYWLTSILPQHFLLADNNSGPILSYWLTTILSQHFVHKSAEWKAADILIHTIVGGGWRRGGAQQEVKGWQWIACWSDYPVNIIINITIPLGAHRLFEKGGGGVLSSVI